MTSHPDADGFIRSILSNPADPTPRLIFADWLDDTNRPGNAAWAEHIRTRAGLTDGGRLDWFHDPRPAVLEAAGRIVATLRMPVGGVIDRLPGLFDLLPPWRITADLGGYELPRSIVELVPESVARENLLMPLWYGPVPPFRYHAMVLAAADPTNLDVAQKLGFILNQRVLFVAASAEGVQDSLALNYGNYETESVDSYHYDYSDPPGVTAAGRP